MKRFFLLTASAMIMAACTTAPYVPKPYDAQMAKVQTIAIADDSIPLKMGANELASSKGTGQAAGGLIGLLVVSAIEGAETSSRETKLAELMAPLAFDPETEFETRLKEVLAEKGYQDLRIIEVERDNKGMTKALPDTDADAVLNIKMVSFGMQKASTGKEWRPAAGIKVQLLESDTSQVLMENMISYNSDRLFVPQTDGYITMMPSTTSTGYMKIKEMDAQVAQDEMRTMLDDIANMIVSLL